MSSAADPVEIAPHQRLVEPHLLPQRLQRFGRGVHAEHQLRRIAGQDFEHREHDERRNDQRRHADRKALQEVGEHGAACRLGVEWSPVALRCPPLSCRTSPPQGGRLAFIFDGVSVCDAERLAKPVVTANLPPCGGDVRQDRGGREEAQMHAIPDKLLRPLHLRQIVGLDRRVLPQPFELGVPHADLRQLEQEAVHRVVGEDLLRLLEELGALGFVGGEVQLLDDLVEGGVVVVEVVVLARIDIDVVRLGVRDDGEVVVLVGEDLLQPVGPFDRDDLQLDADLAQLRGDRPRRRGGHRATGGSFSVALKPSGWPASFSSSFALARSYG